jgi:hypothetical protein
VDRREHVQTVAANAVVEFPKRTEGFRLAFGELAPCWTRHNTTVITELKRPAGVEHGPSCECKVGPHGPSFTFNVFTSDVTYYPHLFIEIMNV